MSGPHAALPPTGVERALARERWLIGAALAALAALAWAYLITLTQPMQNADAMGSMAGMPGMPDVAAPNPWGARTFLLTALMWWAMMIGMMLPSAAPMVLLFGVVQRRQLVGDNPPLRVAVFAFGYLAVWGAFSVAAAAAQALLTQLAVLAPMELTATTSLAALIVALAGVYQLTPLKNVCLRHCRSPAEFLSTHWRRGTAGALRMGVDHGTYCVGCCWLLMGLLFAVGVMNLLWVAALAVFVLLEKLVPKGELLARASGVALLAWATYLGIAASTSLAQPPSDSLPAAATSARQMTDAARALLATLTDTEIDHALFALDAAERSHWSNVPLQAHRRPGLRLGDLDRDSLLRVHDLLRASLSSQGYQKVVGIIRLDDINRAQQVARLAPDATAYAKAQAESFGSGNYFVAFFGDPRRDTRWGWLIQGHHLAASFTVADGKTAFLPMFVGATPLAVEEDVETGWSALPQEVTRGVELLEALDESQRKLALSAAEVPDDVLNGVGNKQRFTAPEGLRAAAMTAEQQRLLRALVEEYVANADFDAADEQLAAIAAAGWDELAFTWRGASGDLAQPFYYRIQGPRIVIELRNTANHVHTITRDPANDYGEAWLGIAYRETITAAERSAAARRAAE